MATLLSDLDTAVLGVLNLDASETIYGTTLREQTINDIQDEIFAEDFPWPFARKKFYFTTGVKTTLQTALTTGSTTVVIGNATGWPTSGSIEIDGDVIAFTGRTSTTLTGVTGIDQTHAVGRSIHLLYSLPSDFNTDDKLELDGLPYDFVDDLDLIGEPDSADVITKNQFEDSDILPSFRWTIVHDNLGNEFIRVDNLATSVNGILHYRKIPATMTSSQAATMPDTWALKVIPPLAAARLLITRGDDEDNLGSRIELIGRKQKLRMKKSYSQRGGGWKKRFSLNKNYKTRTP